MTIEELKNELDSLKTGKPNPDENWVIRKEGEILRLPNGKAIWKKKNHAGAALTNYIDHGLMDYSDKNELKKELGIGRDDSIGHYLIKQGIVTVEQL